MIALLESLAMLSIAAVGAYSCAYGETRYYGLLMLACAVAWAVTIVAATKPVRRFHRWRMTRAETERRRAQIEHLKSELRECMQLIADWRERNTPRPLDPARRRDGQAQKETP